MGGGKCPIVDTWWQTETGGHMISPLPGATPIKPACATFPLPGIMAEVINPDGTPVEVGEQGLLCITKPWPSMIRTIWGDPERFKKSYFSDAKKDGKPVYFSGDGAVIDDEGYITITGRVDDVINVSGHRMGTEKLSRVSKNILTLQRLQLLVSPDEDKRRECLGYWVGTMLRNSLGKEANFFRG